MGRSRCVQLQIMLNRKDIHIDLVQLKQFFGVHSKYNGSLITATLLFQTITLCVGTAGFRGL